MLMIAGELDRGAVPGPAGARLVPAVRLLDMHHLYFGSSPAGEKLPIEGALLAELKRMMRHAGHYHGTDTVVWDDTTARALDAFLSTENLEERIDLAARTIDLPAIAFLRSTFIKRSD